MIRRTLRLVFEGGPRQAGFVVFIAPALIIVGAARSNWQPASDFCAARSTGGHWLALRPAFRFGEWVLLIAALATLNAIASLMAG